MRNAICFRVWYFKGSRLTSVALKRSLADIAARMWDYDEISRVWLKARSWIGEAEGETLDAMGESCHGTRVRRPQLDVFSALAVGKGTVVDFVRVWGILLQVYSAGLVSQDPSYHNTACSHVRCQVSYCCTLRICALMCFLMHYSPERRTNKLCVIKATHTSGSAPRDVRQNGGRKRDPLKSVKFDSAVFMPSDNQVLPTSNQQTII